MERHRDRPKFVINKNRTSVRYKFQIEWKFKAICTKQHIFGTNQVTKSHLRNGFVVFLGNFRIFLVGEEFWLFFCEERTAKIQLNIEINSMAQVLRIQICME